MLFRGLEVGTVTGMTLGTLSDRVMIAMRISKRYQHRVRNNSVFWLASGYSLDFGLTGGVVKTGTFNQFIRGGIAFATPPGTPLAPKAREGKHFLLQESEPKEWREWGNCASQIMPTAPACLRRSVYLNCAPVFLPVVHARGPTHRLFPGRLSDTNARSDAFDALI